MTASWPRPHEACGFIFPSWRVARDQALAGLLLGHNVVTVTGPSGSGKTLLLRELARVLNVAGWQAAVQLRDDGMAMLVPRPDKPGTGPHAILIDDAGRLTAAELESVLAMKECAVLLAGADSLACRFPEGIHVRLKPLSPAESEGFAAQWLAQTRHGYMTLSEAALGRLAQQAHGIPRVLSELLTDACAVADRTGSRVISGAHMDEAATLHSRTDTWPTDPALTPLIHEERAARLPAGESDVDTLQASMTEAWRAAAPIQWPLAPDEAPVEVPAARLPGRFNLSGISLSVMAVVAAGIGLTTLDALNSFATTGSPARPAILPTSGAGRSIGLAPPALATLLGSRFGNDQSRSTTPLLTLVSPVPEALGRSDPAALHVPNPAPSEHAEPDAATREPGSGAAEPPGHPPALVGTNPMPPLSSSSDTAQLSVEDSPAVQSQQVEQQVPPGPPAAQPVESIQAAIPPSPPASGLAETPSAALATPGAIAVDVPSAGGPKLSSAVHPASLPPATLTLLMERGDAMMRYGDVSAARLLYGRAAASGSPLAARAMGRTFDPSVLAEAGARVLADPATAALWYRRAAEFGSTEASASFAPNDGGRP